MHMTESHFFVGPPGEHRGALWPPLGWAVVGPWALLGWALVAPLCPYGPGLCGPLWALVGWAIVGPPWALMGRALVGPAGSFWAGPLWAPLGPSWATVPGLPQLASSLGPDFARVLIQLDMYISRNQDRNDKLL